LFGKPLQVIRRANRLNLHHVLFHHGVLARVHLVVPILDRLTDPVEEQHPDELRNVEYTLAHAHQILSIRTEVYHQIVIGIRKEKKIERQSIECAKAIGLDEEYLKKVEEQKLLREEVSRLKSKHRKENFVKPAAALHSDKSIHKQEIISSRNSSQSLGKRDAIIVGTKKSNLDIEGHSRIKKIEHQTMSSVQNKESTGTHPPHQEIKTSKLRPYLAVVVNNIRELENAYKRISLIASSVGPTKKIWQTSSNTICIIFEKHDYAKQFMLKYHGKTINKTRIDVTLEKIFMNLATML